MNKKILFLFVIFLLSIACFSHNDAKRIAWNFFFGMNFNNLRNSDPSLLMHDKGVGVQIGGGTEYHFRKHWSLDPALMLIAKRSNNDYIKNYPNPATSILSVHENPLFGELPVYVTYRYQIVKDIQLFLGGGGFLSFGLYDPCNQITTDVIPSKQNLQDIYHLPTVSDNGFSDYSFSDRFDTGLNAKIGAEFHNKIILNVSAQKSLRKLNLYVPSRNDTCQVNLGFKF